MEELGMALTKTTMFAVWAALLMVLMSVFSPHTISLILASLGAASFYIIAEFFITKERTFTYREALQRYLLWRFLYVKGYFVLRQLAKETKDIKKCQQQQLSEILKLNSDTEYYRKARLAQVRDRDDYVRLHPVVRYDHFREYFDRMIQNGEEKVITSQSPIFYSETSGTTGKPSLFPLVPYQKRNFINMKAAVVHTCSHFTQGRKLHRWMKLYYNVTSTFKRSANGTTIGAITAAGSIFVKNSYTTPPVGYNILDEQSCRYVHLLFGLLREDLYGIETVFATLILAAFVELELQWKNLVHDIRTGTLKKDLNISDDIREQLQMALKPNPRRADNLEIEFSRGFRNIAKRIWPNLETFECVASGPFEHYADAIKAQYTGEIHFWSALIGASEGIFGLSFWPHILPHRFLLWPRQHFLEFIPVAKIADDVPKTLFMDQVFAGESYEMVLTTPNGLYRYRLGDVVRVVDFYNQCPIVEFLYRSGSLLNLKSEKVSEISLLTSLNEVLAEMSGKAHRLIDFSCCESNTVDALEISGGAAMSATPYYVIFLEISITDNSDNVTLQKEIGEKWDATLVRDHVEYAYYRNKSSIKPMLVLLLKTGAFARLRSFMILNSTTSPSQVKIPKLLRKPELIRYIWTERECV